MPSKPHTQGVKPAHELRDHDVIVGHGIVDWGYSAPYDQIVVHVHSGTPERGSYTLMLPRESLVKFERY